jgi:hypothetical protein
MSQLVLKFDGKRYEVQEPTIQMWCDVMKFKDLLTDDEMSMRLLSLTTGLSIDQIKEADAVSMKLASDSVYKFINQDSKKLYQSIEHNGKKYNLINLNKVSFGQFVDIDTFLQKEENYRISNLNELAAYLYVEEGKKYGETDFKQQIEDFKSLPIKYIEGAIFFLLSLGQISHELIQLSSKNKLLWTMMMIRLRFQNIGGGILEYLRLPKTIFGKLTMLLISPLLVVSIILHILWMLIKKCKKKLKK